MIQYLVGDATVPVAIGSKIIVHCCNDRGMWGAGFSGALSWRYPLAEQRYRQWYRDRPTTEPEFALGQVQFVWIRDYQIWIANLIGQHGIYSSSNPHPADYDAIRSGLIVVGRKMSIYGVHGSIHMPKIGTGLARGEWNRVEHIINEVLPGSRVYVYTLPDGRNTEDVISYFGDEEYTQKRMF